VCDIKDTPGHKFRLKVKLPYLETSERVNQGKHNLMDYLDNN